MEHRRFLTHPEAHRPFVDGDLIGRIGGRDKVDALIDRLYDRIEADPALRPLFGRHLRNERDGQKRFFTAWLGGDGGYSDARICRSSIATISCRSHLCSRRGGWRIFGAHST